MAVTQWLDVPTPINWLTIWSNNFYESITHLTYLYLSSKICFNLLKNLKKTFDNKD